MYSTRRLYAITDDISEDVSETTSYIHLECPSITSRLEHNVGIFMGQNDHSGS